MDITEYISVTEAVKIMGINRQHITRLCRAGKIPRVVRFGEMWLIPRVEAENISRIKEKK